MSLSSVKRYAKMADEGRSLAPKKRPGSKPKLDESARRLLEADLKERPAATLPQRCEFLDRVAGEKVSESTVSRMLKRMRWSRKKISGCERERDEWLRMAWRVMLAERIDAGRLVFVDECGTHTSLAPLYGWAHKGQRARMKVARNWGTNITLP